jgi:hypothetical protein
MAKLWQLKKLSNGEALNEPQKLPENWGPIFGLAGIEDQLGDLSWLGEDFNDQGWVVVGDAPADPTQATEADIAWDCAKKLLWESDWSMLSDVPMTAGNKALWIEYRRALREVRLQAGFPSSIQWPAKPE